ncbi:MAG: hypothetical protein FWD80_03500 [Propionibacteriaceae bacterium]|nr:hypothetical protein [Propionibacteriaceae bacterium]
MKRILSLVAVLLVAGASLLATPRVAFADDNVIHDDALRQCVIQLMRDNYEYSVADPEAVTYEDVEGFIDHVHNDYAPGTHLYWACDGVASLAGLDVFISIDPAIFGSLIIEHGTVSDVTPLSGIRQMTYLSLADNQISEMFDISGIAGLFELDLSYNQLSAVPGLQATHLEALVLSHNRLTELPSLADMSDLFWLELAYNQLSDVSSLGLDALPDLVWADLSHNEISDASALAALMGWVDDAWTSQGDSLLDHSLTSCGGKTCTALSLEYNHITDVSAFPAHFYLSEIGWTGVSVRSQTNQVSAVVGTPVALPDVHTTSAYHLIWDVAPEDAVISDGMITYLHTGIVNITWQDDSPYAVAGNGEVLKDVVSDFTGTIVVTVMPEEPVPPVTPEESVPPVTPEAPEPSSSPMQPESPSTTMPATGLPSTQVPATDLPTTDLPTTDLPTTDLPTTQVPTTQVPTTDLPTTQVPTTQMPATDLPSTVAPGNETPSTAVPSTEAPADDTPSTEVPSATVPEEPNNDAPGADKARDEVPNTTVPAANASAPVAATGGAIVMSLPVEAVLLMAVGLVLLVAGLRGITASSVSPSLDVDFRPQPGRAPAGEHC